MTESDDLAFVRGQLGRANPVTPVAAPPLADLSAPPARRRRATTVASALVGVAAMVGALVAVSVTGGGSSSHGTVVLGPPERVLLAASSTTEAAKSAQMSFTLSSGEVSVTGQGAADLTNGKADFTAQLPAPVGSVEVLSTGTVAYMKVPPGFSLLTGGKPWVKADASVLGSIGGPALSTPGLNDFGVTGVLDWLRGVSGPIQTVSTTETVHGDATTHYRTTVDLAKAAAGAPAAVRARVEQAAQAAGQGVPVDVWIDGQGRLRRFDASLDLTKVQAGTKTLPSGTVNVSVELWGFGSPVDVTPPPADQVSDIGGLLGGLRQHRGSATP